MEIEIPINQAINIEKMNFLSQNYNHENDNESYDNIPYESIPIMIDRLERGLEVDISENMRKLLKNAESINIPENEKHPGDGGFTAIIPSYGDPSRNGYITDVLSQFTRENNPDINGTIKVVIGNNGMSEEAMFKWQENADYLNVKIEFAIASPWEDDFGNLEYKRENKNKNKNRANAGTARNDAIRYIMNMARIFRAGNPDLENPWENPIVFVDDDSKFQDGGIKTCIEALGSEAYVVMPDTVKMVEKLNCDKKYTGHGEKIDISSDKEADPFELISYGSTTGIKTCATVLDWRVVKTLTESGKHDLFVSQPNGSAEDAFMKLILKKIKKIKGLEAYDMIRMKNGVPDENGTIDQRVPWGEDHVYLLNNLAEINEDIAPKIIIRNISEDEKDWIEYEFDLKDFKDFKEIIKDGGWFMNLPQLENVSESLYKKLENDNSNIAKYINNKNIDLELVEQYLEKFIELIRMMQEKISTESQGNIIESHCVPKKTDETDIRFSLEALESCLLGQIIANLDFENKHSVYILRQSVEVVENKSEELKKVENMENEISPLILNNKQYILFTDHDGTRVKQNLEEKDRMTTVGNAVLAEKKIEEEGVFTGYATVRTALESISLGERKTNTMGKVPHICENGGAIVLPKHIIPDSNWPNELIEKLNLIYDYNNEKRLVLKLSDVNFDNFLISLQNNEILSYCVHTKEIFDKKGMLDEEKLEELRMAMGHPTLEDAYNSAIRLSSMCIVVKSPSQKEEIITLAEKFGFDAFGEETINIVPKSDLANKGTAIAFVNKYAKYLLGNPDLEGIVPLFIGNSGENDLEAVKMTDELGGIAGIVSTGQDGKFHFNEEQLQKLRCLHMERRVFLSSKQAGDGVADFVNFVICEIAKKH